MLVSAQAGHKISAKLIAQNLTHATWVKNNPSLHYFESILTHFNDLNFLAAYFTIWGRLCLTAARDSPCAPVRLSTRVCILIGRASSA
ncbi:hypothetical protein D0876_12695 [Klebsiella pneumoniae]|nr:hypothetical protein D0876_12695 [Klebsiella pneumoniae]